MLYQALYEFTGFVANGSASLAAGIAIDMGLKGVATPPMLKALGAGDGGAPPKPPPNPPPNPPPAAPSPSRLT